MFRHGINDIRKGLKGLANGEPCEVIDVDFTKPGKGPVFTRVKLRGIRSGRMLARTLKGTDTLPSADLLETGMTLLYCKDALWHFIDPASNEKFTADAAAMGDAAQWLQCGETCTVSLWNGETLKILPPAFVELAVTDTSPSRRGETSVGSGKPVKLEAGMVIQVPTFVARGDVIRVDTRSGEYVATLSTLRM